MLNSTDGCFWINLERSDRRILIFFFFCLVVIITSIIVTGILLVQVDLLSFVFSVLAGLVITLSITGILAFVYYYKKAIISTRKLLSWFTIFALIFSAVANIVIYLLAQTQYFSSSTVFLFNLDAISVYNIIWQFFTLFLLALFVEIYIMFEAFGLIWTLTVVEKSTVANTLSDITKITPNTLNFVSKKEKSDSRRDIGVICF